MPALRDLVATHALITTEDADAFLRSQGTFSSRTRDRALAALCASGDLVRIRRGVYARSQPECSRPDPYVVASRLAPDAILGLARARGTRRHPLPQPDTVSTSPGSARPAEDCSGAERDAALSHPVPLARALPGKEFMEIAELVAAPGGGRMRVTTVERAVVDIMDRPRLAGDWLQIFGVLDASPLSISSASSTTSPPSATPPPPRKPDGCSNVARTGSASPPESSAASNTCGRAAPTTSHAPSASAAATSRAGISWSRHCYSHPPDLNA